MCPSESKSGGGLGRPTQAFLTLLPGQTTQIDLWAQILLFYGNAFHYGKEVSLDSMPEHSSWQQLTLEGV